MNEFKVGDKVRRTHGYRNGMSIGDIGTVEDIKGSGYVLLKEWPSRGHSPSFLELVEPEFQHGDLVEVRDCNNHNWYAGHLFVGMNPIKDAEYKYITVSEDDDCDTMAWRYCRKTQEQEVEEYTLQQIAAKLNVPVDKLRIKD